MTSNWSLDVNRLNNWGAGRRVLTLAVAGLLSVSCSAQTTTPSPTIENKTILIYFDSDKCPTGVDKSTITATRTSPPTRIYWKDAALDQDPPTTDPAEFEVIFSPFAGPKITSVNGATTGDNILTDAPTVLFKYTVVGTDCTDTAKENYDPYLRVL